jgi:NAD(P)H-dependent FMN reductase
MPKVYLIVGSVRANRIGRAVTEWVQQQILPAHGLETELVDLTDWLLPLADEPNVPATGPYTQEHTRRWSQKVGAADGFIFVTPEYNGGYPAALKNALDHLYKEWTGKPAVIVSYGFHGGDKAAEQLRQVLARLRMRAATANPQLTLTKEMYNPQGQLVDPKSAFEPFADSIAKAAEELASLLRMSSAETK